MSKRITKFARIAIVAAVAILLVCAFSFTDGSGGRKVSAAARYASEYGSKTEALEAGAELNIRLAEEGVVLLKNANNALPVPVGGKGTDAARVTLFGYASVFPEGGSALSDADVSIGIADVKQDIYFGLQKAGYKTNPEVKAAYTDWASADEENNTSDFAGLKEIDRFTKDVAYSFGDYNDAAIVVLGASGAASKQDGRALEKDAVAFGQTGHSRQLDKAQKQVFDYVLQQKANGVFDRVIVIINDSVPLELAYIDEHADAVIMCGGLGANGFVALGDIISGKINPSGHLADTYARDFTKDPTYVNFGRHGFDAIGKDFDRRGSGGTTYVSGGNGYVDENGNPLVAHFVDYEEGIYVGYRYYETRGFTDGEQWYKDNVLYPFGYGMSYTDFTWSVVDSNAGAISSVDQMLTVTVAVTNNGAAAGKDVVQLYYTAPYTAGGVEKSHVVLGDFAKTKMIAPGETDTVTLKIKARDMASYDFAKDNGDGTFGGYVLEEGTYELKVMKNSHEFGNGVTDALDYTLAADTAIVTSDQTGNKVSNAFQGLLEEPGAGDFTILSRSDWTNTWPKRRSLYDYAEDGTPLTFELDASGNIVTEEVTNADGKKEDVPVVDRTKGNPNAENVLTAAQFETWDATNLFKDKNGNGIPDYDEAGHPWYVPEDQMPKYAKDEASRPAKAEVTLYQLVDKSYTDPLWDKLLDQLTLKEMIDLVNIGGYKSIAIDYIGKPETLDTDGPAGWSGTGVGGVLPTRFVMAPVIASTWNKELAYEMGKMIGEQGIWGRSDSGTQIRAYTGWYGAAMNTHRSPFLDRYAEYYSEDGLLAGIMAANACIGAKEKGVYTTVKHFAPHEDGASNRGTSDRDGKNAAASRTSGLCVWSDEQALREIYFKPFQLSVELSAPNGAMSSFSRIGNTWCGGSYGLLTQILRDEWGFDGLVVTDLMMYRFVNAEQMIRAGGDLVLTSWLSYEEAELTADNLTATKVSAIRRAVKSVLYAVANSNAMDVPLGAAITYKGSELAAAKVGADYSASVATAALNTVSSYGTTIEYEITSGFLPTGLTMKNGSITGKPTTAGTYVFTVTASSSVEGFAPCAAQFSVTVAGDDLSGKIDGAESDLRDKLDETKSGIETKLDEQSESISGVSTTVTAALVISIVGVVVAGASIAIAFILKRKS